MVNYLHGLVTSLKGVKYPLWCEEVKVPSLPIYNNDEALSVVAPTARSVGINHDLLAFSFQKVENQGGEVGKECLVES